MKSLTSIITVAAIALTGAAMTATPSHAQLGGAVGANAGGAVGGITGNAATGINGRTNVPNVTTPADPVRQGAAGINSAQAEATRTTGDAARDAAATAENNIARTGAPTVGASGSADANATGQGANASGSVNTQGTAASGEAAVTQQLNREQANAGASTSGTVRAR